MKQGSVIQVAYVVRDLEAAMQRHWDVSGIGPWHIYKFEPGRIDNYFYRGRPATQSRPHPRPRPPLSGIDAGSPTSPPCGERWSREATG